MHMFVPYYVELMILCCYCFGFICRNIGYFTFDIDAIRSSLGKKRKKTQTRKKKKTPTKALRAKRKLTQFRVSAIR